MRFHKLKLFYKNENLEDKVTRNLKIMLIAASIQTISGNFLSVVVYTGYWKKLGASDFMYGLIVGCPSVFVVLQFVGSWLLEKTRARRRLFLAVTFFDRFRWIPFALIPYIIPMELQQARLIASFAIVILATCIGPLGAASGSSITEAVLPSKIRGRFFATENLLCSLIGIVCSAIVGRVLDAMPGLTGYSLLFVLAAITGLVYFFLWLHVEIPPMPKDEKVKHIRIAHMVRDVWKDKNYVKFTLFATLRSFGINMGVPYFVVYLLSDYVKMSNTQLVWYWYNTATIMRILLIMPWGRALDKYGSKPVLRLGGFFTSIMPILWIGIGKNSVLPVIIAAFCTGTSFAACDYACTNLYYSQAKGEHRSAYYAFHNIIVTIFGVALGTAAGGWFLDYVFLHFETLNIIVFGHLMNRYNYFFVFTGIIRFLPFIFILPTFHEKGSTTCTFMLKDILRHIKSFLFPDKNGQK